MGYSVLFLTHGVTDILTTSHVSMVFSGRRGAIRDIATNYFMVFLTRDVVPTQLPFVGILLPVLVSRGVITGWTGVGTSTQLFPEGVFEIESL